MMTARPLTHPAPWTEGYVHEPVLVRECVELLRARPGSRIVDATLGTGGHAEALLERVAPSGQLIGVDRDPRAIEIACSRLAHFGPAFRALHGNHDDLPQLLDSAGVGPVDGILIDLGVSSLQLDDPSRGFSFRHDGPLDMRMDPTRGSTAADLLARAPVEELRRILSEYGEEHAARSIARAIVRRRERAPLERTLELATLVEETLGPRARRYRIHPATRTFQALRIAVNGEIVALRRTVARAAERIAPGGRLVVLSYHSLEDRAVKEELRALAGTCTCPPRLPICACRSQGILRIVPPSPIRPGDAEIERNPRSRSARLRAAERR